MVEITLVRLQNSLPYQAGLLAHISDERRIKIMRYMNNQDRKRSMIAEMLIRKAASEELGISRNKVKISYNPYGKPYIDNVRKLKFNVSHSGDYVVIAKSKNKVGVDIEQTKDIDMNIAKRFFTIEEYKYIASLDSTNNRSSAFYTIWTLKESYIKAIGKGLKIPLNSFGFGINGTITLKNGGNKKFKFFNCKINDYMLSCCYIENDINSNLLFIDEQELYNTYINALC